MSKLKKLITNKRIIILLVALILAVIMINPQFSSDGVAIRGVAKDSAAAHAYPQPIEPPQASEKPTGREIILSINNQKINTVQEYHRAIENFEINDTFTLKTNENTYFLTVEPIINRTPTGETETVLVNKTIVNETTNETSLVEVEEEIPLYEEAVLGREDIGLTVYDKPMNNIQQGLDLAGGTRVLLQPQEEISADDMNLMVANIEKRLNVYGVSDVTVSPTRDFFGNQFISVEIAGVNEEAIKELLTTQGKFEAKIADTTVFSGGDRDILNVCKTATCMQTDSEQQCGQASDGSYVCNFWFTITLSQRAAQSQADATSTLDVIPSGLGGDGRLSENLTLWLDDEKVDELTISSSLKGRAETEIRISGSGTGQNPKAAHQDAIDSRDQLRTVLQTGSLPVKLDIVKTDTISPLLGEDFIKNAVLAGLLAIVAVILVVVIRYSEWKISIPMAITMISEVTILLGFASLIGWKIDMVAIAAIIIAVGSGVDDQIIITDETLGRRDKKEVVDWKTKLKKAFFIIMASYFTLVVAMVPLMFAGAGMLLGFAITTIAGVTIGVLITRPAFGKILETLLEK